MVLIVKLLISVLQSHGIKIPKEAMRFLEEDEEIVPPQKDVDKGTKVTAANKTAPQKPKPAAPPPPPLGAGWQPRKFVEKPEGVETKKVATFPNNLRLQNLGWSVQMQESTEGL